MSKYLIAYTNNPSTKIDRAEIDAEDGPKAVKKFEEIAKSKHISILYYVEIAPPSKGKLHSDGWSRFRK